MWCVESRMVLPDGVTELQLRGQGHCSQRSDAGLWHLHSPGLYLRMRSQMALRAYGSTPAVGSSKITARDPPTKAMATESFLFMPPERVCTRE